MCGIAGMLYFDSQKKISQALLDKMTDLLSHRGPDDRGTFIDRNVGLGFRRLSIIDLSAAGHQPMFNEGGTISMVCNGEIYNFQELRQLLEMKGHRFRSRTDVEVIIHAYEEYGHGCLDHIDGMFAFAIWNLRKRELFLARDRFGIKPLYYSYKNGIFAFASEIKAILPVPEIGREMDNQALWNYFSLMYVPAPQTIYKDIRKFLPSQAMVIKENSFMREWKYLDIAVNENYSKSEKEWIEELKGLFENSIKRHLVADVPVGCFLSGGVDSSSIVAFAAKIKKEPIKTYSMSFVYDGKEIDESPAQQLISNTFKTDHHEMRVRPDILNAAYLLIKECDEPFAVPSAIGLYYISKLASEKVKVVLSGDGGDELFAGYERRYDRDKIFDYTDLLPRYAKNTLGYISKFKSLRSDRFPLLRKIRKGLKHSSLYDYERYMCALSIFSLEERLAVFNEDFVRGIDKWVINDYYSKAQNFCNGRKLNRRIYYDIKTSLADEMLAKMDRCTSMVSIEGRVPFLDIKFAECAMKIPSNLKYSQNKGKIIFKRLLKGILPDEILMKKKQGFNVPIESWLLNDDERLNYNKEFFNIEYIKNLRRNYERGNTRLGYHFWILKCFSVWEQMQGRSVS